MQQATEAAQAKAYVPAPITGEFVGKHVIGVEQFARADMELLFDAATRLRGRVRRGDRSLPATGSGQIMATLFFEASTRTDMSFQAAMYHLGGQVVATSGGVQFSSVYKGENLADTVRAVGCYASVVVLRHPEVGSSYEAAHYLDMLEDHLGRRPVLISGGDGIGEHPTQALLDLYTILDHKGTADGLRVAMVGDLRHGRTVHSLAKLLALYGAEGVTMTFVSPEELRLPEEVTEFLAAHGVQCHETDNLLEVIGEADIIYWTRVQEERFADRVAYEAIADRFVLTPKVFERASRDAILLHPLPRKHEMGTQADHDVLDADPRSAYFRQMENGMFVRMALLGKVLGLEGI